MKVYKFLCIFALVNASCVLADDLQLAPGQLSPQNNAGQIQNYTPPQPQSMPDSPATAPSYQPPNSEIEINPAEARHGLEECRVVDQSGTGMIKPYMADSGPNAAGDPNAWIWVPLGTCTRLNAQDYADVPQEILDKINY